MRPFEYNDLMRVMFDNEIQDPIAFDITMGAFELFNPIVFDIT